MEKILKESEVTSRQDWLYDTIIGFLKSPRWKDPIQQFMDSNCHIFTGASENSLTHTQVHMKFQELIEGILEGYLKEIGINDEQFVECCAQGALKNEFMKLVIDYILAIDDFLTFKKIMEKRNKDLQITAMKAIQSERYMEGLVKGYEQALASQKTKSTPQQSDPIPLEIPVTSNIATPKEPQESGSVLPVNLSEASKQEETTETMMNDFVQEHPEELVISPKVLIEEEDEGEEEEEEEEIIIVKKVEEEKVVEETKEIEPVIPEVKSEPERVPSPVEEQIETKVSTSQEAEVVSLSKAPDITAVKEEEKPQGKVEVEVEEFKNEEEEVIVVVKTPSKERKPKNVMFVSLPAMPEPKKKRSIFETFDEEPIAVHPVEEESKKKKKKKKKKKTVGKLPAIRGLFREKFRIKNFGKKKKKSKKKKKEEKRREMEERRRKEEMSKLFNGIKVQEDIESL